jgi:hypothetical protein
MLRDISQQGACIECPERLMLRQSVRLKPLASPASRQGRVAATARHGLVFDRGFLMEELAQNMAKMHEGEGHDPKGRFRAAC